jgi:hypothetical protein
MGAGLWRRASLRSYDVRVVGLAIGRLAIGSRRGWQLAGWQVCARLIMRLGVSSVGRCTLEEFKNTKEMVSWGRRMT